MLNGMNNALRDVGIDSTRNISYGGKQGSITAAAAALGTNYSSEAVLSTVTIPAGSLAAGDIISFLVDGVVTSAAGNDTLIVRVRLGGISGAIIGSSGAALDVTTADAHVMSGQTTMRTIGASGTAYSYATSTLAAQTNVVSTAQTSINTSADLTVVLTAVWALSGGALASDTYTANIFNVKIN